MNVEYKINNISDAELKAACALVNAGQQLSIVLTAKRLREISFLIVAMAEGVVVGVSCIKKYASVSEIGYTAVCPKHRRQKIGQTMTQLLIKQAIQQDIDILCGIVYESNQVNRKKLEKLEFFKASEYFSRSGEKILCWYCHPLLKSRTQAKMIMKGFIQERQK
jgi:ribosomal protein S18 acetylase RimI-like enzyme